MRCAVSRNNRPATKPTAKRIDPPPWKYTIFALRRARCSLRTADAAERSRGSLSTETRRPDWRTRSGSLLRRCSLASSARNAVPVVLKRLKRRAPRLMKPGPVFDVRRRKRRHREVDIVRVRTSTTRGRFVLPRGAMGRITIFTSTSCGHCRRAKATLESRGLAYSEVSLSAHPERREDMTALASRVTVPQIFLNETHFGGNDQLERRVREDPDGFDDEVERALAMPDPKDARLRPSEASGVASDDDDVSFLSPPRDASSASSAKGDPNLRTSASSHDRDRAPDHFEATLALAKALRDRGAIRDRAKGARVHARCFDGAAFREATRAAFADQRLTTTTKSSGASREETNRDRIRPYRLGEMRVSACDRNGGAGPSSGPRALWVRALWGVSKVSDDVSLKKFFRKFRKRKRERVSVPPPRGRRTRVRERHATGLAGRDERP